MTPLLEQFLSEARDVLQGISEKLMQLESAPESRDLINELFRLVHTLKGNSGLFEFPEMTRVLHAGEDLMDAVRDGRVLYSQALADRLLDAMDFINLLVDEIETHGENASNHVQEGLRQAELLRQLLDSATAEVVTIPTTELKAAVVDAVQPLANFSGLVALAEEQRMALYTAVRAGSDLFLLTYTPESECFFKGEDPFFQAQQMPETIWHSIQPLEPWPELAEFDPYRSNLLFQALSTANKDALYELFRYTPDQICIHAVPAIVLAIPQGEPNGGPVYDDFVHDAMALADAGNVDQLENLARTMLELHSPLLWLSSALRWLLLVISLEPDNQTAQRKLIASLNDFIAPDWSAPAAAEEHLMIATGTIYSAEEITALNFMLQSQRAALNLDDSDAWLLGRLNGVAVTLAAIHRTAGRDEVLPALGAALKQALLTSSAAPLLAWMDAYALKLEAIATTPNLTTKLSSDITQSFDTTKNSDDIEAVIDIDPESKLERRSDLATATSKTLKVDQAKIDILMSLIGEMVVAKNSLPYLAGLAETQYGVRELGREIKSQYAVINRIAEELQDAIMQVRMMPVAFIFQRFPRLVRDTSRKLGKEVTLLLEGEHTEADKNVVEALADPLIHIVRNSLDHGIESPAVRLAAGKPEAGRLTIRASQESNRVYIEISDDGKGIDPEVVKRKAFEKGIIDEVTMARLSDQEAINLVFAAGFSTTEVISDLSGRGVGMDVVRSVVEK